MTPAGSNVCSPKTPSPAMTPAGSNVCSPKTPSPAMTPAGSSVCSPKNAKPRNDPRGVKRMWPQAIHTTQSTPGGSHSASQFSQIHQPPHNQTNDIRIPQPRRQRRAVDQHRARGPSLPIRRRECCAFLNSTPSRLIFVSNKPNFAQTSFTPV